MLGSYIICVIRVNFAILKLDSAETAETAGSLDVNTSTLTLICVTSRDLQPGQVDSAARVD